MIAGVCGGLGDYLSIDPTFIRVFFVLLALSNGIGVFIYLLLWVVIPGQDRVKDRTLGEVVRSGVGEIADQAEELRDDLRHNLKNPNPQALAYVGIGLIILGAYYLIQNLRLPWLRWLDSSVIWPVLIIFAGVVLIIRRSRGD